MARAIVPLPLAAGPSTAMIMPGPPRRKPGSEGSGGGRPVSSLGPFRSIHARRVTACAPCCARGRLGFDSAPPMWQGARRPGPRLRGAHLNQFENGVHSPMVKPEWGTKRTCPKCATRFYDLGKEDPVHCIQCGVSWYPEPVLKSKQPLPFEAAKIGRASCRERV